MIGLMANAWRWVGRAPKVAEREDPWLLIVCWSARPACSKRCGGGKLGAPEELA